MYIHILAIFCRNIAKVTNSYLILSNRIEETKITNRTTVIHDCAEQYRRPRILCYTDNGTIYFFIIPYLHARDNIEEHIIESISLSGMKTYLGEMYP